VVVLTVVGVVAALVTTGAAGVDIPRILFSAAVNV
jgi:hypothetical protein